MCIGYLRTMQTIKECQKHRRSYICHIRKLYMMFTVKTDKIWGKNPRILKSEYIPLILSSMPLHQCLSFVVL